MRRLMLGAALIAALFTGGLTASAHDTEYRCYNGYYQVRYATTYPAPPYHAGGHIHSWGPWYNVAYNC